MPIADAQMNLVAGINEGRAYVNFFGHGGMNLIGKQNLFSTTDLSKLNNGMQLPVFTAMTCMAGNFGHPGYDGFNEQLVLKADGGAIAVWASSGLSYNKRSKELCQGFYKAVFNDGEKVLGDAIRRSQENYADLGEDMYHLELYNLVGDPALELK